ncbi:hypothetical protein C8J57DRAFT_1458653 [Mycena rebaudengoi]|nr:hypothetical protein C8J57DRAFT_1458653 [Mycena rebaudengoi]
MQISQIFRTVAEPEDRHSARNGVAWSPHCSGVVLTWERRFCHDSPMTASALRRGDTFSTGSAAVSLINAVCPTPGALYVGIAALSGAILASNHFLVIRILLPPVLALGVAHHFLPRTTAKANLSHGRLCARAGRDARYGKCVCANALGAGGGGGEKAAHKCGWGRSEAVDSAQAVTGLKLREALGKAQGGTAKVDGVVAKV